MAKVNNFQLPKFELDKLLEHIDKLVAAAPGGVVQIVVDLFCGAGGTSEGIENALFNNNKCSSIIVGINHDKKAIYSQSVNHPLAYYTDEDIRFANLVPIQNIIKILRERYPQCPIIIWASLECTNHSNAKGGMSRDADSRTLAWDLYRYIDALNPDGIWIENVKEFAEWGPLMEKVVLEKGKQKVSLRKPIPLENELDYYQHQMAAGYTAYCPLDKVKENKKIVGLSPVMIPIKEQKGTCFYPWLESVNKYGYHCQHRILNAADYGCPTNRRRLFILFMKKGWPIVWPYPTHSKKGGKDAFDNLKPHVPVKTCLDFSQEGESIFTPGKIESDKTFERVYAGLIKYVAGGEDKFMLQMNSGVPLSKVFPVDSPARVVTATGGNQAVVKACFITKYNGNNYNAVNSGKGIDEPCITVTTQDRIGLVSAEFLDTIYGNGYPSSIDAPAPTVRTKDGLALVQAKYFIYSHYSNGGSHSSIDAPNPTITNNPKQEVVKVESIGHHYILNPQWGGNLGSIDNPMFTIIARMDKAPPYLISTETGNIAIPVFDTDTEIMIKIKEFMALYGIVDIKMRMLLIPELLKIQSFPEDYFLAGSKTDQKKFIGNAVPPKVAQAIAEAMYSGLVEYIINKMAA